MRERGVAHALRRHGAVDLAVQAGFDARGAVPCGLREREERARLGAADLLGLLRELAGDEARGLGVALGGCVIEGGNDVFDCVELHGSSGGVGAILAHGLRAV